MLLALSHDLTTKSLVYDEMLKTCNHKSGLELELHKARMEYLAEEIRQLRERFARAMDWASNLAFKQSKHEP